MKARKFYLLIIYIVAIPSIIWGQNDFAPIGTYWNYTHEPHDGNGYGWDKIVVTKDSIIGGKEVKLLSRSFLREQTLPPFATIKNNAFFGYLSIESDSIFLNDKLIFDFGVETGDSIMVYAGYGQDIEIRLIIDTIEINTINGLQRKHYFGRKICTHTEQDFEYDQFEIIEGIGPVGFDFFSWNIDGCIIGGGSSVFSCYNNGTFIYPDNTICDELVLKVKNNLDFNSLELYPNPAKVFIHISHSTQILKYEILKLNGQLIKKNQVQKKETEVKVNHLDKGIYLIKVYTRDNIITRKFTKL